jgi:hypothetical protein
MLHAVCVATKESNPALKKQPEKYKILASIMNGNFEINFSYFTNHNSVVLSIRSCTLMTDFCQG